MLFRLVRPLRRKDTRNPQFVQRIPEDLKPRLVGMALEFPLGDGFHSVTITDKAQAVRLSLRTADPTETKRRHAAALAYLEGIFASLRASTPTTLTHKQCVALAGEAYRAWAGPDLEDFRTVSVQEQSTGEMELDLEFDPESDFEIAAAGARLAAEKMLKLDGPDLERQIGLNRPVFAGGSNS